MKTVLCFGNPDVPDDALALRFADEIAIPGFSFLKCSKIEDILYFRQDHPEEGLIILDVVKGLAEPVVIDDVSKLKSQRTVSMHDFDLAFFLKLLQATGELGEVTIIGIPMEGDLSVLREKVMVLLSGL